MKAQWTGQIFTGNCLLNYIILGKIQGAKILERRRNQLLDEIQGNENTLKVKQEARSHCLEISLWKKL
jgi:hypothetical protein